MTSWIGRGRRTRSDRADIECPASNALFRVVTRDSENPSLQGTEKADRMSRDLLRFSLISSSEDLL